MAAITIPIKELELLSKASEHEIEHILTSIGVPIESKENGFYQLEITPNRPDFLSIEGLARAIFSFKYSKIKSYKTYNCDLQLIMDESTKNIRPFIGGAVIENINLTDSFLESLMQLQEKLHATLGRKRKKMAIGLHDISKAKPPFFYYCTKKEINFIPLGFQKPISTKEILQNHPKGKEYGHLIKDSYPIIQDSLENVLSFPPIINGEFSKLTINTKKIFIDCTGTDQKAILDAINIICAAFVDRGAKIYQIKINKKPYKIFQNIKTQYDYKKANKILGLNLSKEKQKALLLKMGHQLKSNYVVSHSYRTDILDQIDIVEDLAIAYGYNNFIPTTPEFICTPHLEEDYDWFAELLIGLGFFEVSSWILTNKNILQKANVKNLVVVSNPLTEEFTTLRPLIYPNILEIFSISKSAKMPQKVFEIGPVVFLEENKIKEQINCCFASAYPKANLTTLLEDVKGIFQTLNISYSLQEANLDGFINGRAAEIKIDNKFVGFLGEIHPQVLESFAIEQPVIVCELFLEKIFK
ncbi:MAG: phenylalanine--tRNA ligase subunit beta [Candidatus Omnitrophica bacterium]|nr:phenylalanine--tRNA ligase subunit beta [Candidatus Omnitrophota bacterium]